MRLSVLLAVLALAACGRDPESQLARCEMDWRSASERVQEAYGSFERNYIVACMSAANYSKEFDDDACHKAIPNDYIMSSCYERRDSWGFAIKRFLQ